MRPDLTIGMRVRLFITKEGCALETVYAHISDRRADYRIIDDLYASVPPIHLSPAPNTAPLSPAYTKPFQNLNDLPTFTIDPAESRDFDDAISIVGNTVYVHIVDIHHHMRQDSEIDREATRLGFTLYTAEGNHNIVPTAMAEDEWSLVAGAERRVITVEIRYNETYDVEAYDIYPSSIVVKHRYNYDNAPTIFIGKVLTERAQRTVYNIPQLKLAVDPTTGGVYEVKHSTNTDDAHRMIETFMVTANMIVSEHLRTTSPAYGKIPQRFHTKLRGLPTTPPTGDAIVDSFLAIKTYAYAVYDPEKCGHYGLNLSSYTHFTSPIRRYFDVIMHRMLAGVQYGDADLQTYLTHLNARESAITQLTRLYTQWKLLATLNVGDVLDVVVTRVVPAGVYYLFKPYMMDGFIHVSALGGQRWYFRQSSPGTGAPELYAADSTIKLGDCLKCRITEVDMTKLAISLTVNL